MIIASVKRKNSGNGCGVFTYHYYNSQVVNKHHFKSLGMNMKTFYYHVSWLPQLGDMPDPKIIIDDYKSGCITWREFVQELIFLVDLYQEYKYLGIYKDSQFERAITHLNKVLSDSNLQFEL